jgi:hypothetical protein
MAAVRVQLLLLAALLGLLLAIAPSAGKHGIKNHYYMRVSWWPDLAASCVPPSNGHAVAMYLRARPKVGAIPPPPPAHR